MFHGGFYTEEEEAIEVALDGAHVHSQSRSRLPRRLCNRRRRLRPSFASQNPPIPMGFHFRLPPSAGDFLDFVFLFFDSVYSSFLIC